MISTKPFTCQHRRVWPPRLGRNRLRGEVRITIYNIAKIRLLSGLGIRGLAPMSLPSLDVARKNDEDAEEVRESPG